MIATIVFFLIVGTIVLGITLDLGYRVWRLLIASRTTYEKMAIGITCIVGPGISISTEVSNPDS